MIAEFRYDTGPVNISDLSRGVYILQVAGPLGTMATERLIKLWMIGRTIHKWWLNYSILRNILSHLILCNRFASRSTDSQTNKGLPTI